MSFQKLLKLADKFEYKLNKYSGHVQGNVNVDTILKANDYF